MYQEELIKIQTKDLENIALWKVFDDENVNGNNIFLTHGTFSNRKICFGIAAYFASKGYTCWIMEWRNHGESSKTKQKFNLETVALFDIKAVFEYLFEELKIDRIDCITHSGGGICLTMYLIKNVTFISKINSISMFGCQAFGACNNYSSTLKIL
jgi:predicted alpha/beta hydrolase